MKHWKALALCVLAISALGAVVAGGANAAAPEYGRCVKTEKVGKTYTGNYSDSKCTKKSETKTGKYEWFPGAVKKFQTSTGGVGVLEEVGKNAVNCQSESSTGEFSGTKEVKKVLVTFKGCKAGPFVCTSEGHPSGELETNTLEGRVVWENEAKNKAALELFPAAGEEQFIEFNCSGELSVAVKGAILTPLKGGKMTETEKLKYKSKHGFQSPEYYEENGKKIKAVLESNFGGKGFAQAGQTITSTVKAEEKLELNLVI